MLIIKYKNITSDKATSTGQLFDHEPLLKGGTRINIVTVSPVVISRPDVADFVFKQLNDRNYSGKAASLSY